MDMKTYFVAHDGRLVREGKRLVSIANKCDVSPYYLFMVASGYKVPSAELAANIEYATGGVVDRRVTLPLFPWDAPAKKDKAA